MWPLQGSSNQTRTHPKKKPQKPSICSMESFRLRVSNKSPKWNEPLQYALLEGLFRVCVFHSASKQTQMICSRWNLFVIKFLSQTARLFFFFPPPPSLWIWWFKRSINIRAEAVVLFSCLFYLLYLVSFARAVSETPRALRLCRTSLWLVETSLQIVLLTSVILRARRVQR